MLIKPLVQCLAHVKCPINVYSPILRMRILRTREAAYNCLRSHSKLVAWSPKRMYSTQMHIEAISLFLKSGTVPGLSTLLRDPRDFWTWTGALHCLWVWCFWVWMSVFVSVFADAHDSGSYPSIPPRGGQGPIVLHGLFDGSRVLLFKEKSSQINLDLALSKSLERLH